MAKPISMWTGVQLARGALLLAGVLAVAPAQAGLLQLSGGIASATTPPVPGNVTAGNDVISSPVSFWDNATLTATAPIQLSFYYVGAESGYVNTLHVAGGGTHSENNIFPGSWNNPALFTITLAAGQAVPMFFTSSGWSGQVAPGSGSLISGTVFNHSIGFSVLNCAPGSADWGRPACFAGLGATSGDIMAFLFDDGGAVPNDDNHDDYVGFMVATPVPLPAPVWLFGSGVAGLLALARRRRASGAFSLAA